ncbi:hypothetical protein ACHAWO_007904 [Cyclotella atomus]|uniref:Sulfatase N-terminal domain-containing protein n=1 Tax=Cyclotella atomus TaxID=382360 RepID=A0ABD3NHE9_9STRA
MDPPTSSPSRTVAVSLGLSSRRSRIRSIKGDAEAQQPRGLVARYNYDFNHHQRKQNDKLCPFRVKTIVSRTLGILSVYVLFQSSEVLLSSITASVKLGASNEVHSIESKSFQGSDDASSTNLRKDGSNKEAETETLKIMSFVVLSLMTIIFISMFLRLPENITWRSIQAQFCCSLVVHFQGLLALQTNDGRALTMLKGVAGAGLEGIFLLSLMIMLLSKQRLWANGLVCLLGIFSIMILCATVTFFKKTGLPSVPDMFGVISGLRGARAYIKAESAGDMRRVIKGLLGAYGSALPSAFLVWKEGQRDALTFNSNAIGTDISREQRRRSILYFFMLFMALVVVYCLDAWVPIFHVYASICGSFIFSPGKSHIELLDHIGKSADGAPNLILLIHDSLSGEYAMTREESVGLMPFLQKEFQSNDNEFFFLEDTRSVSGDTMECLPAITSGCLPLNDKKGKAIASSTNMATQAKMRGYQTLSFSSSPLNMKGTKYFMIEDALSVNFDRIWHPGVTREPAVNAEAQSDRLMGKHFQSWIQEWSQNTTKAPFFAQFYYFDAHYPFFSGESNSSNRLDGMLMMVDKGIEDIFSYLNDVGELDNTIVVVSGDHGETYTGALWGRLAGWDANVLHPLTFMYVPKRLSARNPDIVTNLNHNRQQLVSTLDLFPTMLHILDGISSKNEYNVTDNDCVRGYDLLSKKIDPERIAWSFPSIQSNLNSDRGIIGVHYRRSSLVCRFGWPKDNHLKILTYDKIVGSRAEKEEGGDVPTMDEWRSLLERNESVNGMPHIAMNSKYFKTLLNKLDGFSNKVQLRNNNMNYCGSCYWIFRVTCDQRMDYMMTKYELAPEQALLAVMENVQCTRNQLQ